MSDQPLLTTPKYTVSHIFSTDDVTGTYDGLTQGDIQIGDLPIIDFTATPKTTQEGVELFPIDSEFGFYVTDFDGAIDKIRDYDYAEGWAGNLMGEGGEKLGIVVSDAPTDTFKTPAVLGTWLAGIGGTTVKASTEHYSVMQNVLSDQAFPGDPDAVYALDDDLILLSQNENWNGQRVADLLANAETYGVVDKDGNGVLDIRDLLNPNESTIAYDIAYSTDYSVTMKDDGKLLYRWGNTIKRPNDIRMEVEMPLPDEWKTADGATGLLPLFRVTGAELVTNHTITNNPNDQIRPEDFENESAIGKLPTYQVVADYNDDGNGPREVWVSVNDYYAGDGTFYPAGTILKDEYLAQQAANSPLALIGAASEDLLEGYTNAWYTTMDREPFEASLDEDGNYISGPRWRLQPDKYGQDLPSVVIPTDPSLPPPPTKDEVKYEVGEDTTTVINLLDWEFPVSPLAISAGWQINSGTVSENGLNMTENFDIAFYVKGDIKPATLYNTSLLMDYEEISIFGAGETLTGGAGEDYLVGQGGNTFTGGAESDLFVLSYGVTNNLTEIVSSVVLDFEAGVDVIGLIDLNVTEANFRDAVDQAVVGSDLQISVAGIQIATLTGVTTELAYEDFLLINRQIKALIEGTAGDDLLAGDIGDNVIDGLEGDDTIYGQEGDDTLIGGTGSDELYGGDDDDKLLAEFVDDNFDPAAEQVFRLYDTAFDRLPMRPGHLNWTDLVADGVMTLQSVANAFAASAEFAAAFDGTTNTEFVTMLYDNALDRLPDALGLAGWVDALDDGDLTRAEVLKSISESREHLIKTEADSLPFTRAGYQQDYTDETYRAVLATQADEAAGSVIESLTMSLANGTGLGTVFAYLMATAESIAVYGGTTNTEFVNLLFQNVLDRLANPTGLTYWTGLLDSATLTRAEVAMQVAQSAEAITKLGDQLISHMRDLGTDDVLEGGAGDDIQFGGVLSDAFVFKAQDPGADKVAGLEVWDTLHFEGFGYAAQADALAKMSQVGDDVVFFDQGVSVSFVDTQLASFTDDMIFVA